MEEVYDPAAIEADFAAMRALEFNVIRIRISPKIKSLIFDRMNG